MRRKHWIEWIFGCFIGLLPLGAWILAHQLAGPTVIIGAGATRELLFFALSTASTALLNLSANPTRDQPQARSFGVLVVTVFSAVCYGEFLTGEALRAVMRVRIMYYVSISLAILALIHSAVIAGILSRRSSK